MFKISIKFIFVITLSLLLLLTIAIGQSPDGRIIDLDKGEEDIRILGDDSNDYSGYSVSIGDINGDGYDDIIIGAPCAVSEGGGSAGETYVMFGSASPKQLNDLNRKRANMTIYGDDANDFSGWSISSGDINGDGYDDVIIGAPFADPPGGGDAGEAYVIFGSASPRKKTKLNRISADITIYGNNVGDESGISVSSGDINGDGYDDIIIGSDHADPTGRNLAGETYVIFGSSSPPATIDLNIASADMTIYGDDEGDISGTSVSCGDINGDSYDDIIIGAPTADQSGGDSEGETYVIFGSLSPPATIDLNSESAGMTIYGDDEGDMSGTSVSCGDINGDSYDDIIIGAPTADQSGGDSEGETYVIFGSLSPPATIDLNSESAGMTIYGDDEGDMSGYSVSSGDINGDGYDDLIIGAPHANTSVGDWAGKTYIIYGYDSPSGTTIDLNSESADITIYGDDRLDRSSVDLASGDINGDGYDDLIIGANYADPPGGINAGEIYVIFGYGGIPIAYDFSDTNIAGWQREGTGKVNVVDEQLMLKKTSSNFCLFPKGAFAKKCDIEAKVTRTGGNRAIISSSIFFSYENNKNYWELKMQLYRIKSKNKGEWILQHMKDGMLVEQHIIADNINRNQQYHMHIEVSEEQLIVKVDDVEKINIFLLGDKPTWGKIAIGSIGPGKSLFDDLKIY